MMKVRTVVTGLGAVSPLGNNVDDIWNALLAGKSGIARVTRFNVDDYPTQIAGELKGFDPTGVIEKKELRRMDLAQQYAIVASEMAMKGAGLDPASLDPDRCG